jgi:hypothetical protein
MVFVYCEHTTILEPLRGMEDRIEIKAITYCPEGIGFCRMMFDEKPLLPGGHKVL